MTKKTTTTIYNHLNSTFWTQRQCRQCQTNFTLEDYQQNNYQLHFIQVIKTESYHLEVVVQLEHKKCCLICNFEIRRPIYKSIP